MREIKGFIFTAIISGIIGVFIAIPFILIYKQSIIIYSIKSFIVGFSNGVISRLVFMFFYRNVKQNTIWAFCSIFFTTGIGTFFGAFILGLRNILFFFIIIIFAEIIGLTIGYLIFLYDAKLNEKLKDAQEKIKTNKIQ